MKKTVLSILFLACACLAFSQEFSFHQGEKSNKKAYQSQLIHLLPGNTEEQIIVVEPNLNAFSRTKAIMVRIVNSEWKDSKAVTIKDTKGCGISAAYRTDGMVHLVIKDIDKDRSALRHVVLDAATLEIQKDVFLMEYILQKNESSVITEARSSDGNYYCSVFTVWDTKSDMVKSTSIALYDRHMSKHWEHTITDNIAHEVLVTDEGKVVIGSLSFTDPDEDKTTVRLSVADASGTKTGEFSTMADVEQLALLQYANGKIVATALEGETYGLFSNKRDYTACHAYLFDMNLGLLQTDNRHAFTEQEIRTFNNEDLDTKVGSPKTDALILLDQISTPDGGAVLYHRTWHVVTRNAKTGMTTSETYYSKGMLLVRVNLNGEIVWTRGIMHNNQNAVKPQVGADIIQYNDNLYVITNESKEESNNYTPLIPAKRSKSLIMANTALAIYYFTPEGDGAKQMLASDGKFHLHTPLYPAGNGEFYLLTGAQSPKISSLIIK